MSFLSKSEITPQVRSGWRKAHLYQLIKKAKPLSRIDSSKEAQRITLLNDEEVEQQISYYQNLIHQSFIKAA
ncbi:hypothetical protein [Adhaeribacter aquaticus]|uniref:hypothetical protein n=1 Tax=Adhaeribacter aquaticus TaxID=299567 RepID=UPI00041C1E73|nr:hypothetical protein [Adhaeribacter aquaticus]